MTTTARVVQINISAGGVPKLPVEQATVTADGIIGDKHNDMRHHGGPSRALCLYGIERIRALQAEGHPIAPGTTGENITTEGLDFSALHKGDRLRVGDEVVLEVTTPAAPCRTIRGSFCDGDSTRISQKLHPGWSRLYARVVAGGIIRQGDGIEPAARVNSSTT